MIDWISGNWVGLLAVIGAAYALARAIVFLTPTPKDDEAVNKIGKLLKTLGVISGLDLKQGR